MSRISKSWLSHVDSVELKGSRDPPPHAKPEQYTGEEGQQNILSTLEDIGSVQPRSKQYLREYELRQATDRLLSTKFSEPETESIDSQISDFSSTEDISSPLRASVALANDHAYVSDLIVKQVQFEEKQTGKQYEVLPDSIQLEANHNYVKFRVKEKGNPASTSRQVSAAINKAKLTSKGLMDELRTKAQ